MATTIQVRETTKQLLDSVKTDEEFESYDEAIRHLLKSHVEVKDMFGATKKKPLKFGREDEMVFHEL